MNSETLLKRLQRYQAYPIFHPLTCGNNSLHANLEAKLQDGKVILICPDCNYTQEQFPDLFYYENFEKLYEEQENLFRILGLK